MRANNPIYRRYDDQLTDLFNNTSTDKYNDYHFRTADLLLQSDGVEVAAFPTLYPRQCFADTDLKSRRRRPFLPETAQPNIKASFLKKCQSRCAAYWKNVDLVFLLHDVALARSTTAMLTLAEKRKLSTDVFSSNNQGSEAYWRGEQDVNADVRKSSCATVLPHDE